MAKLKADKTGCLVAPAISGEKIAAYRNDLGLTQEQFAKIFNVPITTLQRWERNRNVPRANASFMAIAREIFSRTANA